MGEKDQLFLSFGIVPGQRFVEPRIILLDVAELGVHRVGDTVVGPQ